MILGKGISSKAESMILILLRPPWPVPDEGGGT